MKQQQRYTWMKQQQPQRQQQYTKVSIKCQNICRCEYMLKLGEKRITTDYLKCEIMNIIGLVRFTVAIKKKLLKNITIAELECMCFFFSNVSYIKEAKRKKKPTTTQTNKQKT